MIRCSHVPILEESWCSVSDKVKDDEATRCDHSL